MSNAIYPTPKGLAWTVLKTPSFSTIVQQSPAMVETTIAQMNDPIWNWQLIYEWLYDNFYSPANTMPYTPNTDLRTMMGFFLAHGGKNDNFLFDDPSDDWVGPMTWQPRYDFNPGAIVIDPSGHGQLWSGGMTGPTAPAWNDSGGSVNDGTGNWADQGTFSGASAQTLSLVSDTSNPVSAVVIGSSAGTGFAVGDYLGVTGGGGTGAILEVATLSGSAIATLSIVQGGTGYTTTSGAAMAVLTGSGSGSPTANITATTIYYTPLQRNMGGLFLEDVTDLNTAVNPLRIWANGVLKVGSGTDYTLLGPGLSIPGQSYLGMYLKWVAMPIAPITGAFNFYFRVRFATDDQDFEQFMQQLWTIGGGSGKNGKGTLELVTSRVANV